MLALDMTMEIGPSQASHVAFIVRTIVAEQQDRILENLILLIFDAEIVVRPGEVRVSELLEFLRRVIGEDHKA